VSSPVCYLDPVQLQRDLSVRDLSEPTEGPHAIQILIGQAVEGLCRAWDCAGRWCRGPRIVPNTNGPDDPRCTRRGRDLEKWVSATGAQAELGSFITGLCRDQGTIATELTVTGNFGSPGCSLGDAESRRWRHAKADRTGSGAFTAGLPLLTGRWLAGCRVRLNPVPPRGRGAAEAQMSINHPAKLMVLGLAGAAVAVAVAAGAQAVSAQHGARPVNAAAGSRGNPDAVPPIMAPLRTSELAEIRRAEAQLQRALSYRLPVGARYSNAEMNIFAVEGYARP
jgi:hypothetical protein